MKTLMMTGAAVLFWCGGLWFFQDTLAQTVLDREQMRREVQLETVITIGAVENCKADVSLAEWADLNRMGIYRWATACEEEHK